MKLGRPSSFTPELADTICERLIEGESLKSICRDPKMPSASMVFRWLRQHETFRDQYAIAKDDQADALADEILEIADDGQEDVNRSRLRVDARKWVAARLKPKKYGDRQTIAGDAENPIQHAHTLDTSKLSTEALRELMAAKDSGAPD